MEFFENKGCPYLNEQFSGGFTSNALTPVVFIKDNAVFANSRDVADFFVKLHFNVLNDIRGLLKSQDTPAEWFRPVVTINEQNGQRYRAYDMTRDGFTLLVMGYTGAKALEFKVRYIQEFNRMEGELGANSVLP